MKREPKVLLAISPAPSSLAAEIIRIEAKVPACKWCREGYRVRHGGDHFITTSIIPAHIRIVKCTAVTQ